MCCNFVIKFSLKDSLQNCIYVCYKFILFLVMIQLIKTYLLGKIVFNSVICFSVKEYVAHL